MTRILPPALFVGIALMMAPAVWLFPGPIISKGPIRFLVAGMIVGVGLLLTVGGSRQFGRVDTNIKTFDDPDRLVADGLFAWSRNPMYLGFVVALVGLALGLGVTTPWLGPIGFVAVCERTYIPFEEARMRAVFGSDYAEYERRVRRWLGRRDKKPLGVAQ